MAVGLLTQSQRLTQLAGAAAGYFTLSYSRKQEVESDDLGIHYMRKAGYDPYAAADMLGALGRNEQFLSRTRGRDEARSIPEWPVEEAPEDRAPHPAKVWLVHTGSGEKIVLPLRWDAGGAAHGRSVTCRPAWAL